MASRRRPKYSVRDVCLAVGGLCVELAILSNMGLYEVAGPVVFFIVCGPIVLGLGGLLFYGLDGAVHGILVGVLVALVGLMWAGFLELY